jgi:hypothetical protein
MPKAIWNNRVVAGAPANQINRVGGNVCFPLPAAKREFL